MKYRLGVAMLMPWPGLAQIWSGQAVLGLMIALLFAATLNLAVMTRFVWTEAFEPGWSSFFLTLAIATWLASSLYTIWWVWLCHPDRHKAEIDRLFRDALECYLQGRWNESRRKLERVLDLNENDVDALMQLGTLYARTHHPALARRAFRQCLDSDRHGKWRWEVGRALEALDPTRGTAAAAGSPTRGSQSPLSATHS